MEANGRRRGRRTEAEQAAYEAEIARLHALHVDGATLPECAREGGYACTESLAVAFRRRDLPMFKGWARPRHDELIRRYAEENRGLAALCQELGRTHRQVQKRAKQIGITVGPRKGSFIPHGFSRYQSGCRCEVCTKGNRERGRAFREQVKGTPPPNHGLTGYTTYACRCDVCTKAGREANRRTYLRRKERQSA